MEHSIQNYKNQKIDLPIFKEKNIEVYLKREDLIHPIISGNKFRKFWFKKNSILFKYFKI